MKFATLTLNPCLDKTLYFGSFQTGSLNRSTYGMLNPGGKGVNVSRLLNRLGIRANPIFFAGGHMGALLLHKLESENIECTCIETDAETRLCIKMIESSGVCTEANEPGGPIREEEYARLQEKVADFAFSCCEAGESGCLFAGGSIPAGLPKTAYRDMILGMKQFPIRFILDADGEALKEGITAGPWLIKPNEHELSQLVGYEITGRNIREKAISAAKASRRLFSEYGTRVLCTMGADGAVFTGDEGSIYVNAPHVPLKGFTGAGDTFLASFMFAYEKNGKDVSTALCFAASASAAKVELTGTDMPDKKKMLKYVDKVQAEDLSI